MHHESFISEYPSVALIALDLDGTLMGSNLQISPRVCNVIKAVQRSGVITTLATGRMYSATLPFARILGIKTPLICYQGGWIQAVDGDVLYRESLPNQLATVAVSLGYEHKWHTVVYADGNIVITEKLYSETFYKQLLGHDIVVNPDLKSVVIDHTIDKILYVGKPGDIVSMAQTLDSVFASKVEVVRSHKMFIEIVPRNVNKGRALAWLASHYNIAQSAVMAIGDQENDVPMLTWAGFGVAMGNATPAAFAVADWIAPSLTEDGVAVALEKFVLNGEKL
jgi:Cof subfamily protein (haloacid dehalogenase superfamily)